MSSGALRRLGMADAVVLGLAAMLGTGVFAVWAPAAAAAGPWLVLSVVLAGLASTCTAASLVDLALTKDDSGGGYGYGYDQVCPGVGRLAGVAFLVGRLASAAAAAAVFGWYVLPSAPMAAALPAIVVVSVLNSAGVRWTARAAYALVGGTLAVLLVVVAIGLFGPGPEAGSTTAQVPPPGPSPGGVLGVLSAAGLIFFAFAGYARIATLNAEVADPARTLRRAAAIALGVVLVTYLLVAVGLLVGLGPERLATEPTPLVVLVDSAGANAIGVLVRVGAAVATGAALLTALVGVSHTTVAMARRGDLPAGLGRTGGRGTPYRADAVAGLITVAVAVLAGPAAAIALSACALLVYYAVVNLAAARLPADQRRWPRWVPASGLVLCAVLALLIPVPQMLITAGALVLGWSAVTCRHRR